MNLNQARYLQSGWDGYQAPAPSDLAISSASKIIEQFHFFKPSSTEPCADGGITIQYTNGRKSLFIDCYNSGEICWAYNPDHTSKSVYGELSLCNYNQLEQLWNLLREESYRTGTR